jgi:glycosyltransferase involved in cell wall biosynthesis
MRVVYVSTIERGGPISHLQGLVPRVAADGVDVHVICAGDDVAKSFRQLGVDTTVFPLRHKLDVAGAWKLGLLLDADVVHTHDRRGGLLVRPQARRRGARAVHTLHGLPEAIAVRVGRSSVSRPPGVSRRDEAWFLHGYLRVERLLARFGPVIVPSEALKQFLVGYGMPPSRLRVVRTGIEPGPGGRSTSQGPLRLATAANLEYWKGVDVLLDACARVDDGIHVDVYGVGSEREALERQAARLGVDADFHGFVDDLRSRLRAADVFVLPSRGDNFPVSVLEAMAEGVAVVATRVGGIPELVADGETGVLVEPDDPAGLGAALERLAADEPLRNRLGEAGWSRARAQFDPADAARRVVAVYEELLAG